MEHITRHIGLSLALTAALAPVFRASAQRDKINVKRGNEAFVGNNYDGAIGAYDKALLLNPSNETARFNRADALYRGGKYDEAAEEFEKLAKSDEHSREKAASWHNLGNCRLRTEQYDQAVKAYREALKINPDDAETRYNMAYALKKIQKKQQDKNCEKPNQGDKGDKNEEKKDGKDDKNQKDGQDKSEKEKNGDQDKNGNPKPDENDGKADEGAQEHKNKPKPISRQEAEMVLKALDKNEKDIRQKLMKQAVPGKKNPNEKDW